MDQGTIRIEDVPTKKHRTSKRPKKLDLTSFVTPPTNQGLCGSCWAISTSQCLRDRINRTQRSKIPELSYQFVADCAKNCISYKGRTGCARNCNGGFLVTSYQFLQNHGTPRDSYHPNRYGGKGEDHIDVTITSGPSCPLVLPENETLYKCEGYYNVHLFADTFGITNARMKPKHKTSKQLKMNADNIAEEVFLNGPVSVCFNLYSDFKPFWNHKDSADMIYEIGWQFTDKMRKNIDPVGDVTWTKQTGPYGIFFKTGHSVSIVGYGQKNGVDYWICRNSWGRPRNTYQRGFFKIRRNINCSGIEGDVCACKISALTPAASMEIEPEPRNCVNSMYYIVWCITILLFILWIVMYFNS